MADPLTACRRIRSGLGDRAACATHAQPWPCRIRALSLTRPWTELVITGLKTVENRSWAPHELGVIVVHAAKSWDDAALDLVNEFSGDGMLTADDYAVLDGCALHRDAPTGYLGIATVTGCHHAGDLICVSRETPWTPSGLCSQWGVRRFLPLGSRRRAPVPRRRDRSRRRSSRTIHAARRRHRAPPRPDGGRWDAVTEKVLRLSPDLTLPLSAVTEPIGIFGQRGFGKSWTAVDLVEELYHAGLPSCVIDVKGDWWGIRSSRDGKREGLPFLIFGNVNDEDHPAHVPLEPGSARAIARFVAERNVPCIIDVSHLSKTKARQWVMEFAEELYELKRRHRSPLMLVVDEADVLIPQRLAADLMRLLGAMEDIAKRGRQRGLGITVATQRVADVNKSVTDLLTTLIIHNVSGARTRKALMEWVDDHARDASEISTVLSSLSTLDPGEVWVWSPSFLRILQRVRMREIQTFDSHATPEPGQSIQIPRRMADIDVAALSAELNESIERAKADDPRELRKQVADLQRQLATRPAVEVPEPTIVEVPVLDDATRALVETALKQWDRAYDDATLHVNALLDALAKVGGNGGRPDVSRTRAAGNRPSPVGTGGRPAKRTDPPSRREPDRPAVPRAEAPEGLSGSQTAMLDALAWFESVRIKAPTRGQVAWQSGVSPKSSGFEKNCSTLRTRGLIHFPGTNRLGLTDAGRDVAVPPSVPPTSDALQEAILARLSESQRTMLTVLIDVYPGALSRDELADRCVVSARSSGFEKNISTLRSLGLADYPEQGYVAGTELLWID